MADSPVVRTDGLTKRYGRARGIEGLDLEIPAGVVLGCLGPNGAGKTTTIRLLLDLIRPTAGRAEVFGLDAHRHSREIRARVGYLPGDLRLYEGLSGRELVEYFGRLRGRWDRRAAEAMADRLGLDLRREIRALSHGNRQKIGILQALVHRPDLVILDEPTTALDPLVQVEVFGLLEEVRRDGRTVFFSSHVLPEVERICDRVAFLREGRLVAVEPVAALQARAVRRMDVRFAAPVPAAAFAALPGVREAVADGPTLRLAVAGPVDAVVKAAACHEVVDLVSREPGLEDLFLGYYAGAGDAA